MVWRFSVSQISLMKTRTWSKSHRKNEVSFFSCTFFRCLYTDLDCCFNSLWCWKWWRFPRNHRHSYPPKGWTRSKKNLFQTILFRVHVSFCSLKHVLNTEHALDFTIYSCSNSSMGNRKMGTPSKVTCDSFIAKLVMNFHILQQFVGVWNLRVAISNELHTHQENQVDRCLLARVGWPKERKSNHRKNQGSSERERERDWRIASSMMFWTFVGSWLEFIQDLSFNSKSSMFVFDLNSRSYHTKFEDLTSTPEETQVWPAFLNLGMFCPVKSNFCYHKTRSNISRQFLWWNSWVSSFMFL